MESWIEAIRRGAIAPPDERLILSCDIDTREPIDRISIAGSGYLYETYVGGRPFAKVIASSNGNHSSPFRNRPRH